MPSLQYADTRINLNCLKKSLDNTLHSQMLKIVLTILCKYFSDRCVLITEDMPLLCRSAIRCMFDRGDPGTKRSNSERNILKKSHKIFWQILVQNEKNLIVTKYLSASNPSMTHLPVVVFYSFCRLKIAIRMYEKHCFWQPCVSLVMMTSEKNITVYIIC